MTDIETAEVIEALRAMVKDPNLSVEYSPTLIVAARLLSRRDADRTAPAKEASVDERIGDRALDLWREYAEAGSHRVSEIEPRTLLKIVTELQSRRSSPVREGEGGQATPKTASHPSPASSAPLSIEERRLATHALAHNTMGQLHLVLAASGLTYAEVAKRAGEREKTIKRMFHDYDFVAHDSKALVLAAHIASVCGYEIHFSVERKEEIAPTNEMGASGAEGDQATPSLSPSEPSGRGESGGIQGPASEASMNKEVT